MYAEYHEITMTTLADGSGVAYSDVPVTGIIAQIQYVKNDFADGSTMTLTGETTGIGIWSESAVNASAVRAPLQPAHAAADGAALVYADAGEPVNAPIAIANERLKMTVASAGNAKSATWRVWLR